MTTLLGSKRWIAAVMAAGALAAVTGCTASGSDGGTAATSAGTAGASAIPSAAPTTAPSTAPSAAPSAAPGPTGTAPASATPSASAAPGDAPSPSASPSPSVAVPTAGGPCTAAQLTGAVEDQLGGGAAGSVYRTLVLTNASDRECTVQGYPGVSYVDAAGTQIGAPAERDGTAAAAVTLAPGASASTTLQQTNAENYGADCGITQAAGVRVYPPGAIDSLVLPQDIPACSAASIVLMRVGTLQPAS
ncbi:DUF4232 domain-containing protein [Arthrobacter sp. N1]|uniref:DUF4232 domain-containing protein n=1 Tax=Arthrobacter sp. N1 TaxID=619291 RepID=UPI003BB1F3BA